MKYLFLNSYLNAIEKHVADQIDFDRMVNSDTSKQAFEVLNDTDYGKWITQSDCLEEVLKKEKIFFSQDLKKMGGKPLVDLFSLKADIINLRVHLKRKVFKLDSGNLLSWGKSEKELKKEFEEEISIAENKETPAKLDDYLTEVYFNRLEKYAGNSDAVKKLIKDYRLILKNYEGEIRDKKIKKLEEDFISLYSGKNEGLAPILAFFMKKWRAEKKIRTIMTGKKINFEPKKIKKLVEDLRSL